MSKVANILARKGNNVISVSPDTTVYEALKIMSSSNIGSVVVLKNGQYSGLLTERDYARKIIVLGRSSADTRVEEVMSTNLPAITSDHTVEACMELMSSHNVRYLPVIEEGRLTGLLSIMDLVTETIRTQKDMIDHLENYIKQ